MEVLNKIKAKLFNPEIIKYIIFGVLTTLVNIISFFLIRNIANLFISNTIAWILSIIFAYFTNKIWVFGSRHWTFRGILKEFTTFTIFRLFSFAIDMGLMLLLSFLGVEEGWAKIVTQIFVVILNYLFSKLFIFKN